MRLVLVLCSCALLGIPGAAVSQPDISTSGMTVKKVSDEDLIRAVLAEFETGWNKHNPAMMFESYVDSADFVNWRGTMMRGKDAIVAHHARIHTSNMKESVLKMEDTRIRFVRPDVAIVRVSWRLEGAKDLKTMKSIPTRTGYTIRVMTRENGRWIVHTTQNTDILPPPG